MRGINLLSIIFRELTIIPPPNNRRQRNPTVEDIEVARQRQRGEEPSMGLAHHGHAPRVDEVQRISQVSGGVNGSESDHTLDRKFCTPFRFRRRNPHHV